jgi:predicted small metal-binding protein
MAYLIRCADAGMDCPSFTTETKELIKHVELHANEAHPEVDLQPEQVEALVKSSTRQRATTSARRRCRPALEQGPPAGCDAPISAVFSAAVAGARVLDPRRRQ